MKNQLQRFEDLKQGVLSILTDHLGVFVSPEDISRATYRTPFFAQPWGVRKACWSLLREDRIERNEWGEFRAKT